MNVKVYAGSVLAKIHMVTKHATNDSKVIRSSVLAKIHMVTKHYSECGWG